jgi:hypothetical protein
MSEQKANIKNPFKPGDKVKIKVDIKDAYQETWHKNGDIETIKKISSDGVGVMFWSDLGTHFKNVEMYGTES